MNYIFYHLAIFILFNLMKTKLNIDLTIKLMFFQDGNYVIAYSPDLDLSTYAKTVELAKKRFIEALEIFFESSIEKNNLYEQLLNLGWTLKEKPKIEYTPPVAKVPKELLIAKLIGDQHINYQI